MENFKVILNLIDGAINLEEKPEGMQIIIKDYDVPDDYDCEDMETDEDGDIYQEIIL